MKMPCMHSFSDGIQKGLSYRNNTNMRQSKGEGKEHIGVVMQLIEAAAPYLFTNEHRDDAQDRAWSGELWQNVHAAVSRGMGFTQPAVLKCGKKVLSVAFRESFQERRQELPIGARTLLFDAESPHSLVARAINKFGNWGDRCDGGEDRHGGGPMLDYLVQTVVANCDRCHVYLQRKMAGFIGHAFSLDGVHLEVVSKHAVDGEHAMKARAILMETVAPLGGEAEVAFAAELFTRSWIVSFECIAPDWDCGHPILEAMPCESGINAYAVVFSITFRDVVAETAVCTRDTQAWCAKWGLRFVDTTDLTASPCVSEGIAKAEAELLSWEAETEGYVLLLELPAAKEEGRHANHPCAAAVTPIRFKLKSLRYRVLRLLRSMLLGEHRLSVSSSDSILQHAYAECFVAWALETQIPDRKQHRENKREMIRSWIRTVGVWRASLQFEASLSSMPVKRGRDEDVSRNRRDQLVHVVERLGAVVHAPRGAPPYVVVMLCGLPGCGKSTLAHGLICAAATRGFSATVIISRDEITKDVTESFLRNNPSEVAMSAHQRRCVRRQVHTEWIRAVRDVTTWCSCKEDLMEDRRKVLVVLDACHAQSSTRAMARALFAPRVDVVGVFVDCGPAGPAEALRRATARTDHPVLKGEDASQAFQDVMRVFQPPTADEAQRSNFKEIVRVDGSGTSSLHETVSKVLQSFGTPAGKDVDVGALVTLQQCRNDMRVGLESLITGSASLDDVRWICYETSDDVRKSLVTLQLTYTHDQGPDRDSLWLAVAEAVVSAASSLATPNGGSDDSNGSRTGAFFRRVASRLLSSWSAAQEPCAVVEGHLRWMAGKFLRRDSSKDVEARDAPALAAALRLRFSEVDATATKPLHVTVAAARGRLAGDELRERLREMNLRVGLLVTVVATHVLMDDKALCLAVNIDESDPHASELRELFEVPPHITIGHTHHVKAIYAADMPSTFRKWQMENNVSGREQGRRGKNHNFVRIELKGRLAVKLQWVMQLQLV